MRITGLCVIGLAGVLLVGAGTGTTFAAWQDSAPLAGFTLRSGSLGLSVDGAAGTTVDLTGLGPGESRTGSVTLRNVSPGSPGTPSATPVDVTVSATALTQQAPTDPTLASALELQVGEAGTDGCATPTGATGVFGAYPASTVVTRLAPGEAAQVCITLALPAATPAALAGAAADLSLTFRAEQVRP